MNARFSKLLMSVVLTVALTLPALAITPFAGAQEDMPLTERGTYHVGGRVMSFVDEQRAGREIKVWLWYPGIVPEDQQDKLASAEKNHLPLRDLAPDVSHAPYPLVLYSAGYQGYLGEFNKILEPLVSQGYVVASLEHPNNTSAFTYVDRPLDVLYVIDQLATLNEDPGSDLAGMMNVNQIGVIGFNGGAYTALAVSGARVDTEAVGEFLTQWGDLFRDTYWPDWDWAAITEYHDRLVPPTAGDPLWTATTDARIRAVVSYMPCDVWQFGDRGLAAASTPALIIAGTRESPCSYDEAVEAYMEWGSERNLLTLVGSALTFPDVSTEPVVRQSVTAFLGYRLQGKTEYAKYLTADYAEDFSNVVWGVDESAVTDPQYITEMTFSDAGIIGVGDTIAGSIAKRGTRMGYSLTLDADTTLNVYANATRTYLFDPVAYILDEQGNILFWNDELSLEDNSGGVFDAGFEGLDLSAGNYTIVVSGWSHATGHYDLVVESAE